MPGRKHRIRRLRLAGASSTLELPLLTCHGETHLVCQSCSIAGTRLPMNRVWTLLRLAYGVGNFDAAALLQQVDYRRRHRSVPPEAPGRQLDSVYAATPNDKQINTEGRVVQGSPASSQLDFLRSTASTARRFSIGKTCLAFGLRVCSCRLRRPPQC